MTGEAPVYTVESVTILLVEDEQDHAELEIRALRKLKYADRIDVVKNGAEALDYLLGGGSRRETGRGPLPDVILMDMNLPGISGRELLEELRKHPELARIPVLAVSANTDERTMLDMLREGAVDYITKPFKMEELAARVGTHLKMKKLRDRLDMSEKLASTGLLAAGISHEIKNRMNSISTAMYFIRNKLPDDEKVRRSVECIDVEIKRGIKLINDLLQFSRPQVKRVDSIDLNGLVDYVISLFENQFVSSGVKLSDKRSGGRGLVAVVGDYSKLTQALANVLQNAMQAAGDGGGVGIDLDVIDTDRGRKALIRVTDTGSGIEADAMRRVFEPFFTTKHQGSGLGLSVSHSIVKEHGGAIEAGAAPEGGAVFDIILPLEEPAEGGKSDSAI